MKAILSVLLFTSVVTGAAAQTPILNSYPSARPTVFLDFDGQYVTGTSWNFSGPINAQPSGLSDAAILEIFDRVAEDYRIFNINITTDSTVYAAAPVRQRTRVIITPTYQWYGQVGGTSYVGSFAWGDNTPAWVFPNQLWYSPKMVAEAISHEAGHTLGLQHQSVYSATCYKTEYNTGIGSGEISWAPIMGVGYDRNLTTWYNGTSSVACDRYQNDISVISNNAGLRSDDIADTHTSATAVSMDGLDFTASGLINSSSDKDVYKFTLTSATNVRLSATPEHVGEGNSGANLDVRISLLNQKADTIGRYNPADLLNAGVDSNLKSGTYYVVVEGVANAYLNDYGSVGYYSISGSIGAILPVHRLTLSGKVNNNVHALNWIFEADEAVKKVEVQYSKDGINFDALTQLGADSRSFSWKPFADGNAYYRVRVVTTADERSYYSNIITLRDKGDQNNPVQVMNSIITNSIAVSTDKDYSYQLMDGTGRLLQRGQLVAGTNRIDVNTAHKGLMLLRVQGTADSYTLKLIKQ